MFWGIILKNGQPQTQVVEEAFHISMAALEAPKLASNAPVSVMLQQESNKYCLCTLQRGACIQQPLDLHFSEGETVTLSLNGEGVVHLSGYLLGSEEQDSEEDDEGGLEAYLEAVKQSGLKRKTLGEGPKNSLTKKLKQPPYSEDDEDEDEDEDATEPDSDDDKPQVIQLSPKKVAGKAQILGGPFPTTTTKYVSGVAFPSPKNASKAAAAAETPKGVGIKGSQVASKTPNANGKPGQQKKNVQTPVSNGEKSSDESATRSNKRRKNKNKKKKKNSLNSSVGATPTKA